MKQGMQLQEVAQHLKATQLAKVDFVGSTDRLFITPDMMVEMGVDGTEPLEMTNHAKRQMTEWAKIPAAYADRCMENDPALLANNLNHWLHNTPANRLVRSINPHPLIDVIKPTMRAFVSDRFRIIDNYDVANAVLPPLMEAGNVKIESIKVDEDTLYIKAWIQDVEERIMRPGHKLGEGHNSYYIVRPGIEIGNGEVGNKSFWVAPALWEDHCTNYAVFRKNAQKRVHLGAAQAEGELWKMLSDNTQKISNEALMAQMRDYASSALDKAGVAFRDTCDQLREQMDIPVRKPESTMKIVADRFGLNEKESDGILEELLNQGDMNVYGLQAAVTKFSQSEDLTYERSSELEGIGGEIIDLPKNAWTEILEAA